MILSPKCKIIISLYNKRLDSISSNIVDIFYDKNCNMDEYKVADLVGLNTTDLPYVAIWSQNINRAKYLDISQLTSEEIFEVVKYLVKNLKEKGSIKGAIDETQKMVNTMQDLVSLRLQTVLSEAEQKTAAKKIVLLNSSLKLNLPFAMNNLERWATFLGTTIGCISLILQIFNML